MKKAFDPHNPDGDEWSGAMDLDWPYQDWNNDDSSMLPTCYDYLTAEDSLLFANDDNVTINDMPGINGPERIPSSAVSHPNHVTTASPTQASFVSSSVQEELPSEVAMHRSAQTPAFAKVPATITTTTKPSRSLTDPASVLTEYYFKEVAGLFSCFDGHLNPFRTVVAQSWTSSPAMLRAMQSMAGACLAHQFPQFKTTVPRLRADAISLVRSEPSRQEHDPRSLLTLLMIGQTSSWFDPHDLGIPFLTSLKKRVSKMALSQPQPTTTTVRTNSSSTPPTANNNVRFFQEAIVYWEMLLSFVSSDFGVDCSSDTDTDTDTDIHIPIDSSGSLSSGGGHTNHRIPHPWTGICRDTQAIVHRVGALVRQERLKRRRNKFVTQRSLDESTKALELAYSLEKELLDVGKLYNNDDDVMDPGDHETPVWHLQTVSEIYRRSGLLHLYRVFPDLRRSRCRQERSSPTILGVLGRHGSDDYYAAGDDDGGDLITSWLSNVGGHHDGANYNETGVDDNEDDDEEEDEQWLLNLAVDTLRLLESIPITSSTKCLQPVMLVSCASELRLPPLAKGEYQQQPSPHGDSPLSVSSCLFHSTDESSRGDSDSNCRTKPTGNKSRTTTEEQTELATTFVKVVQARKFVTSRLSLLRNILPPLPIDTCLELVRRTWSRMDGGETDVYWIDVMMDHGLHTTMG